MKSKPKSKPPHGALRKLSISAGIPYETLGRWKREGTDVHDPAALAERIARAKPATQPASLTLARLAKLEIETERIRHAVEVEKGRYVSASEIQAHGQKIGFAVRSLIDRSTHDLPPILAGRPAAEISPLLKAYMHDLLLKLADHPSPITKHLK